jgi:hypothetical protein
VKTWIKSGLRPVLSRQYLLVFLAVFAANLLYGFAVAINPLLLYLSLVFLVLYGVCLILRGPTEAGLVEKKPVRRKVRIALAVILLCSLVLRGVGAAWGFPILGHADEYVVTDPAVSMIERGSINPGYYNRPNHVSIYASEILYPIVAKAISHDGVPQGFDKDRHPYYLSSRLVTAGWGVLMTVAAYLIGSMAAPAVGIIAAALFAIFPPFVEHSHYITPDVPVSALLMFVLLYCLRYLKDGRILDLFLGLVFSCIAIAEKYPAFLTLPLLLAVVVFRASKGSAEMFAPRGGAPLRGRKAAVLIFLFAVVLVGAGAYGLRHPDLSSSFKGYISSALHHPIPDDFTPRVRMLSRLLIAGGVLLGALAVFLRFLHKEKYGAAILILLGMPLIVFLVTPFLFINFSGVFSAVSGESRSAHLGADNLGYLGNLIFYVKGYLDAAGIVSVLFMVIGTAFVFKERSLLPLLFSFFFAICLSALGLHFSRWGLPMYVGPLLLVSIGVHRSFLFLRAKMGQGGALALLGLLCAFPFASLLLSSVATTNQMILQDTRAVAQRWCDEHGVTMQNTVYDGKSPFKPSSAKIVDFPGSSDTKFVLVSSDMYNSFLKEKVRYKARADMYERIFALPRLASFTPVEAGVSSSFEFGNVPVQVDFLERLNGRGGPAYSGPTILIFQKTP